MRKLPRRLPSNSPSLAWVAFAVLLLALGGGLAGLYTHRQNQESTKLRLIQELKREVAVLEQRAASHEQELKARKTAVQLKLALKDRRQELLPITPERRVLINDAGPAAPDAVDGIPPTSTPAAPAASSVMAVVGRP